MPVITVGSGAATDIKPGTYEATLIAVNVKHLVPGFNNPNNEEKMFYEWVFALDNGEQVQGLTSSFTGPKSTTFKYLVALEGPDKVVPGVGFDTDLLIGKRALVQIGLNDNGWPRIEGLMPPLKPAAPVAPRAAAPVAVETAAVEDELPF
jgi:hypothetical protein